jgi:hypothetical protein
VEIGYGLQSVRLKVDDIEAGTTAIDTVMIASAEAVLEHQLSTEEAYRTSIFGLRMLGVPTFAALDERALRMLIQCRHVSI